jgi:oligosaccharide reducing-end xylanase
MKTLKLLSVSLLLVISGSLLITANAQIPADYEVATWYQFKKAAVSYTFDDNTAKQLTVALPLFDQYDFNVTLNTVTGWNPNWTELKKASVNGHEIASHTISHPVLNTLNVADQEKELQESQSAINKNITDARCVTIAYPNCVVGDLPAIQKYYIAGRICSGTIIPAKPSDFYRLSSIIAGTQGSIKTAQDFNTKVSLAKSSKGWCLFLIHGIDDDGGWSPVQSSELGTHLKFMNDNAGDYWVGTFGDVVKYIQERNAVSLVETVLSSDSLKLSVTDHLNDTIYNVPLTMKKLLPEGWPSAKVYVENVLIHSSISVSGDKTYVVFDAVPDRGEIYLAKSNEVVLGLFPGENGKNIRIGPIPFSNELNISIVGEYNYAFYTIDGKLAGNGTVKNSAKLGDLLLPGMYFLILQNGKEIFRTKIIKS